MFLGLHDPTVRIGLFFVLLAVIGVAVMIRMRMKQGKWERSSLVMAPILVLGAAGFLAYVEHDFDTRDAAVVAKLNRAGFSVVRLDGEDRVVVKRGGCTADYVIQGGVRTYPKVWPLVPGTGEAVSGCPDDRLDEIFIP